MKDPNSKKRWDRDNAVLLAVKLLRKGDAKIVEYVERVTPERMTRSELLRAALNEYINNHPIE